MYLKNVSRLFVFHCVLVVALLTLIGCQSMPVVVDNSNYVSIQGDRLYVAGDFTKKSTRKIKTLIEENPQLKVIVLTESGGSIDDDATYALGRYIREKGLNTHLLHKSMIASGAVDLFLSGVNRTMERGARLGVHSWSGPFKQGSDYPLNSDEHKLYTDYATEMLGSDDFYWFTLNTPAKEIHWMSEEEIIKFNLITEEVLPPSHGTLEFRKL